MPELTIIVREQTAATRKLLQQIELRQSPSDDYDTLLNFLLGLCDQVDSEVEAVSNLLVSHPRVEVEQALQQLLVFCSHVLREVHYYCENFDHADRLVIPNPTMQLLGKLARDIRPNRPFILRGTLQFNYMYNPIGRQLNRLARSISEEVSPIDENFCTLSLPLANSQNILANCILFHEFGHLIVDSLGLIQEVGKGLLLATRTKIMHIIQEHAQVGLQADFDIMERVSNTNEILENWIHESLADMIGLHLLGPAHLSSFLYWIRPFHSHEADDPEHPSDSYRLRLMIDGVESLGWKDFLAQETPAVWETVQRICRVGRQEGDYRYDAAAESLPLLRQSILEIARNACGAATYRPEALVSTKDSMLALLERGIPPAEMLDSGGEVFRQFDTVSILNAGWLFYEKDFPTWRERFSHLNMIERGEFLSRLLTKAIEISFVKEASSVLDQRK